MSMTKKDYELVASAISYTYAITGVGRNAVAEVAENRG